MSSDLSESEIIKAVSVARHMDIRRQTDLRDDAYLDKRPRMRIAVFLECSQSEGGGFQQALSTVESLANSSSIKHDVVVFTQFEQIRQLLLKEGINAIRFKRRGVSLVDRWSGTVAGHAILRRLHRLGFKRLGRHLDALLEDHEIDLVVLNECTEIAWRIGDHPFIVTIWDLSHRDYPDFPEAYADRRFERHDRSLRMSLTRALAVIVNSPSGARRIVDLYQVDPSRIIELPFLPSLAVRRHAAGAGAATIEEIRRRYDLPARYVFYPAFFYPLKNHLYLLEALVALERQYGIILDVVLCGGGPPWQRTKVGQQVQALGLTDRVHFLGWIPDKDVPALYEGAVALVMPTYSGPTNLPPLEAVTLGCPVIYSDLPSFREQMGDAALYCDLADVSSLADHLAALIQDSALRDRVQKAGQKLAAKVAKIDYGKRLQPIFDKYAHVRRRWAWPKTTR
jgi:glycosyltransferase involved in cell wall biosynthesis